jgi:1-deoxy-D-xylulose-5-phosphate synthase
VFDLSFLRFIPNLMIMAPKDENELRHMLHTAILHPGPAAVRYPRGNGEGVALDNILQRIPLGTGELLREGHDLLLLPVGNRVSAAMEAASGLKKLGIEAAVINPRFIRPLDEALICEWASRTGRVITIEDNVKKGGFGSAILELFAKKTLWGIQTKVLGLPDKFMEHGTQDQLRHKGNIDAPAIIVEALVLCEKQRQKSGGAIKSRCN